MWSAVADAYVQVVPQDHDVLLLTHLGNLKFQPDVAMALAAMLVRASVRAAADTARPEDLDSLAQINQFATGFLEAIGAAQEQ
jgi:hypothetical protein